MVTDKKVAKKTVASVAHKDATAAIMSRRIELLAVRR